MSNFLAIATVTAALQQIISEGVLNDVPGTNIMTIRPDDAAGANSDPRINIFLYQASTNTAFRNADLPTRRSDGTLARRPQAALDLHYLFTFYGEETRLEPQRLLGSVVKTLHAQPLLTPERIQAAIAQNSFLAGSDLDQQLELVNLSSVPLNLEELSKLWSVFFQTAYSLSIAYQASVVLIESEDVPQPALPVRERILVTIPFVQPVIDQVQDAAGQEVPITAGSSINIIGRRLRGEETGVRIAGEDVTPPQINNRQITLPLSLFPAGTLRAGIQGVQVTHELLLGSPPTPHRGVESNVAPFVLHPTITGVDVPNQDTLSVTLDPRVGRKQRVVLFLNEQNVQTGQPRAYRLQAPANNGIPDTSNVEDTDVISFDIGDIVEPGDYLLRVQIDGAESLLEVDANGLYSGPAVTI